MCPHFTDEETEAQEMEMCASGHKAGKDSDRRSLAPEPAG